MAKNGESETAVAPFSMGLETSLDLRGLRCGSVRRVVSTDPGRASAYISSVLQRRIFSISGFMKSLQPFSDLGRDSIQRSNYHSH